MGVLYYEKTPFFHLKLQSFISIRCSQNIEIASKRLIKCFRSNYDLLHVNRIYVSQSDSDTYTFD